MKVGLLLTLSLCMAMQLSAQDRRGDIQEKIESKKIAYLSDKLDLSTDEAQLFWPLYNEYNDELKASRTRRRTDKRVELTEAEADKCLDTYLNSQQTEIDVKREYVNKFKDVIGSRKTLQLWRSEREFKEDILKQVKGRRKNRSER
jgi:hypothetical protein